MSCAAAPVMALDEAIERLERLLGASIDWTELSRFLPARSRR